MTTDAAMPDPVAEAGQGMVSIPIEHHVALLHAASFARAVIVTARGSAAIESGRILDTAEHFGLHEKRCLTEDEIEDPEALIALLGIDVDEPLVNELAPSLTAALEGFEPFADVDVTDDQEGDEAQSEAAQ